MYPGKKRAGDEDYVLRDAPSDIVLGRPSRAPLGPGSAPPSTLPPEGEALLDVHLPRPPRMPSDCSSREDRPARAPSLPPVSRVSPRRSTLRPRAPGHSVDVVRGAHLDAVGSDRPTAPPRDALREALQDLVKAGPDDVSLYLGPLRRFADEDVIAAVEKFFPGPLWIERHVIRALPEPHQVSALGCALASYGKNAVPALARILVNRGPDPRFYAAVVARGVTDARLLRPLGRVALGSDVGARRAATAALRAQSSLLGYQGLLGWLRQVAESRKARQVWRIRSLEVLAALGDETALDVMLGCLGERDRSIARAAHQALVRLTAHDLGTMRMQWRRWRKAQGNLPRAAWLIDGLADRREAIRNHALQELERVSGICLDLPADAPRSAYLEAQERYRLWRQSDSAG